MLNKGMKNAWFKPQNDLFELQLVFFWISSGLLERILCPEILNQHFCGILSFVCI